MFDSLFSGITALATTIGGLAGLYSAWSVYTNKRTALSIEGYDFCPFPDGDSALIYLRFSAKNSVYIKSISYKGGLITMPELNQEPEKKFNLGLLVTPPEEDASPIPARVSGNYVEHCFAITPLPKYGESIKLKVDIGLRFYSPVFEFWPSSFSGSSNPDFGKWV